MCCLKNGAISEFKVRPEEAGLPVHPFDSIVGGSPEHNASKLRSLLAGEESAYRDAVLLNAAAALVVAGTASTLPEGAEAAKAGISSGSAMRRLEKLVQLTSGAAA